MKKCNKTLKTKNGNSRGKCSRKFMHSGGCNNLSCRFCGICLTKKTAYPGVMSGKNKNKICAKCNNEHRRIALGRSPKNFQYPGKFHIFPCGCSGVLPKIGEVNKFAIAHKPHEFACRTAYIIICSQRAAKKGGYIPVPKNTPHSVIAKMMEEKNCERCGQPLKWEFGRHKTPHLHHSHMTGEVYGFTHPQCNPLALERELEKLKDENKRLQLQCEQNLRIPA